MGQRLSLLLVTGWGGGTVRIGRCVDADIGGGARLGFVGVDSDVVESVKAGFAVVVSGTARIMGGGNINPSVAFLLNCLAKSDACHHSRNFNAKIEAGSRNLVDDSIVPANTRGFSIELLRPGL